MKVFNLTDVSTPKLKQHKLENHTFIIGPHLVLPGQSQAVDKDRANSIRGGMQTLINFGALALGDQPPASYLVAKEQAAKVKAAPPPAPKPPPAPTRRTGRAAPAKPPAPTPVVEKKD